MTMPPAPKRMLILLLILAGLTQRAEAAPTSISKLQDMQFGSFLGGGGGSVTIDASGARSASGGVILFSSTWTPARFSISGNPGKLYTITLPASFNIVNGADQMTVSGLTSSIPVTGNFPAGGTVQFTVGGTLAVNANQRSRTYSGSLQVSVR